MNRMERSDPPAVVVRSWALDTYEKWIENASVPANFFTRSTR